jgi:hypothetical protein
MTTARPYRFGPHMIGTARALPDTNMGSARHGILSLGSQCLSFRDILGSAALAEMLALRPEGLA